ncbi:zinc finger, C2H2 [Tanacetum coccineum]
MMIIKLKKTNRKQSVNTCRKMVVFKHLEENSGFQESPHAYGYECKTCKKKFKSFQALGGHQGIHRKIKPNEDNFDDMCTLNVRWAHDEKVELWRQKASKENGESGSVLTMEELERSQAELDERMRVRTELILAAKEF